VAIEADGLKVRNFFTEYDVPYLDIRAVSLVRPRIHDLIPAIVNRNYTVASIRRQDGVTLPVWATAMMTRRSRDRFFDELRETGVEVLFERERLLTYLASQVPSARRIASSYPER
jgi:hypothetical protein